MIFKKKMQEVLLDPLHLIKLNLFFNTFQYFPHHFRIILQ